MKNIFLILVISVLGSTSFAAEGYECFVKDRITQYLLLPSTKALSNKAKILTKEGEEGTYKSLFTNAEYQTKRTGTEFVGRDNSVVNWRYHVRKCFVRLKDTFHFVVTDTGNNVRGNVLITPNIKINPTMRCPLMPPPPAEEYELSCNRLIQN